MWVSLSKSPHWGKKRVSKAAEEAQNWPAHLMKKPKTKQLNAETMVINGMEAGHCSLQVSFFYQTSTSMCWV